MSEVHRYYVVKMLSKDGNRISYDPYGPEVVMASAYDQLKAESDALRKDAERYRWLRQDDVEQCRISRTWSEEQMDAAIDAAMGKGEQS